MEELDDVDARVELGLPGEDLASFSKELDLLVTGSRGYGPLGRTIHGSTSNYLQRHARSPLLVLPRPTEPDARREGGDAADEKSPVPV